MEIFESLERQKRLALSVFLKAFLLLIIGALILLSNTETTKIKTHVVEFSLPVTYVIFGVCLLIFQVFVCFVNYLILSEFVRVASNKLFKFDSAWILTILEDGSNAWSLPWIKQFRYFQSGKAHSIMSLSTAFAIFIPVFMVILLSYSLVLTTGIRAIYENGLFSLDSVLIYIGYVSIIIPLILFISIFVPFTFHKNTGFIRWNFLVPLYRRSGLWPPKIDNWITPPAN